MDDIVVRLLGSWNHLLKKRPVPESGGSWRIRECWNGGRVGNGILWPLSRADALIFFFFFGCSGPADEYYNNNK
jgi:hypothetical protein